MNPKIFLVVLSLLVPAAALAQTPPAGACCSASTSRLDELLNPVSGGDELFFSQPTGAPNISFVIDNSCSMVQDWPVPWCSGNNHCNCPAIDELGYDPMVVYEPEIASLENETFHTDWFRTNAVYEVRNYSSSALSYGQDVTQSPGGHIANFTGARNNPDTYATACNGAQNASARTTCRQCLATKGYFIGRSSNRGEWRATGNFLNHYSPRYIMARRVLKQVIRDVQSVRMTTSALNHVSGSGSSYSSSYGPQLLSPWNPTCSEADPYKNAGAFFDNREALIQDLDDKLRFHGGTPLARSLYAAGYGFQMKASTSSTDHVYRQFFGSTWQSSMGLSNSTRDALTENPDTGQKAVCFACTFNAIILLSDGEPTMNANETTVPVIGSPQIPRPDCNGSNQCTTSDLDEVARWLWNNDLRPEFDGVQKVATYTIAFGLSDNSWGQKLLRYTAQEGGGRFFPANNTSQLRRAILDIFDDINSRNIAFSAANVASLQVTGGEQAAVVPRMSPRRDQTWLGYLWRFGLFNEFIEDEDRNGDGDKDDVFIIDASGQIVVEDRAGQFVRQTSGEGAEPYWEAGARLREKQGSQEGWQARKVWTVLDTAAPSGSFTSSDQLVQFTSANWQQLKPYLGISGTQACPTVVDLLTVQPGGIMESLGLDLSTALSLYGLGSVVGDLLAQRNLMDQICHRVLIDWTLGRDLGDEDGDGNRTETRLSVLGDIFHSSPVTVDPPVDKFLCDLGLHNQCVRTLYSNRLGVPHTPLEDASLPATCGRPGYTGDAYDKYHHDNRRREKVILVGANDGMLHAFRDTRGVATCEDGVELIEFEQTGQSGHEAWALVPPDALSRLHLQISEGHKYFVDGDIMVRDIWADVGTPDLRKQPDEFKTVAIAAMGRGGTHYFAVEVLWQDAGNTRVVRDRPQFLWMFPQPCTDEASLFGKTLYALAPKPPPVGPVLLEKCDSVSEAEDTSPTCGTARYDKGTEERWVAMLSGGWSPGNEKGRGVYMVDAYRGVANTVRNDNLLWKFDYNPNASGHMDDARRHMTHSVAAPVSMVDYGANHHVRLDGFFDTGIVGDLAGQLWVFRFHQPGQLEAATGLVRNWSGGRAFQQDLQGGDSVDRRWPFYVPASVGLQPDNNALRAYIGTGNRYDLLSERAGSCRYDDPLACAKYGCDVNVKSTITKRTLNVTDAHTHWGNQTFNHSRQGQTSANVAACGTVTAAIETHDVGCGIGSLRTPAAECKTNAAGVYTCARTDIGVINTGTMRDTANAGTLGQLHTNRFYGVWVYGRDPGRMFEEHRTSTGDDWQTARQFDEARLTDRRTGNAGDLVDVTATTCLPDGGACTGNQATSSSMGWFFEYRDAYSGASDLEKSLAHKTASGASLIASCVLWNTLYPEPVEGQCSSATSQARFHQADFITGAPNCAYSFNGERFQERGVLAPPPEPATAVQFSKKTGQIRHSSLIVEPGQDQATTVSVTSGEDVLQSIYELPVSRELHDCRHSPNGCKPTVP